MYGEKITRFQRFMQRFQLEPIDIVRAERKDAALAMLQAVSKAEYAELRVKMHKLTAEYHGSRVLRLQEFIDDHERADPVGPAPVEFGEFNIHMV